MTVKAAAAILMLLSTTAEALRCPAISDRVSEAPTERHASFSSAIALRPSWNVLWEARKLLPNGQEEVVGARWGHATIRGLHGQVWRAYGYHGENQTTLLYETKLDAWQHREPSTVDIPPCGPFEEQVRAREARTFPLFVLLLFASFTVFAAWCRYLHNALAGLVRARGENAGLHSPSPFYYWTSYAHGFFPFFGMVVCVAYSLQYDFFRTVSTGCLGKTANFLPSISAAISGTPQRYLWGGFATMVQAWFPFHAMVGFAGTRFPRALPEPCRRLHLRRAVCALWFLEQLGLLVLTVVSSADFLELHQLGFGTFAVCALLGQPLSCLVDRWSPSAELRPISRFAFVWKRGLCVANTTCFAVATLCWVWQEYECTDYVYTVFALSEYLFVATNIMFHMISICSAHAEQGWALMWVDSVFPGLAAPASSRTAPEKSE